jgi:hypothetical protein
MLENKAKDGESVNGVYGSGRRAEYLIRGSVPDGDADAELIIVNNTTCLTHHTAKCWP